MPLPRGKFKMGISDVIGLPGELTLTSLPSRRDVIRYFNFVFADEKIRLDGKNPSAKHVADLVSKKIQDVWEWASLPTIEIHKIRERVLKDHEKVQALNKSFKRDQNSAPGKKKLDDYLKEIDALFDICPCKCKNYSYCKCSKKVPQIEREFLKDQRGPRQMRMEGLDHGVTRCLKKRQQRKSMEENLKEKRCRLEEEIAVSTSVSQEEEKCEKTVPTDDEKMSEMEPEYLPDHQPSSSNQTRVKLEQFARSCDHTGVSDRSAARLASALLADIDKSVEYANEKLNLVIDRNKVRRERQKSRQDIQSRQLSGNLQISGLFFDGRKDESKISFLGEDGKHHQQTQQEYHISLLKEPGSIYLGHITVEKSGAEGIAVSIWNFLCTNQVTVASLLSIGTDGEATNTGYKSGVISRLERHLGHSVQWVICQLHMNELPLRHMIKKIDGDTSGPKAFTGPVGKGIKDCEKRPVVEYEAIEADLPEIDVKTLSSDQLYLYKMCQAVLSGDCPIDLAMMIPGPLNHARWLTTASRILRQYVATSQPTRKLIDLATFILRVYAPSWFTIKKNSHITDAPRNLWMLTVRMRYLTEEYKKIVFPVVQNNAYAAHPENILLTMLVDKRSTIREEAATRILAAREKFDSSMEQTIRKFYIPELNFYANDYTELIDWTNCEILEPPITTLISSDDLIKIRQGETVPLTKLADNISLPCHNQAVERCVKEVTEASRHVCGEHARDGFIRARLLEREINPKFETKSDFTPL
jgi:hypothetical protein